MNKKVKSLKVFLSCLGCIAVMLSTSQAPAGELISKTFGAHSYSGSRDREYQVYVPDGYTGSEPVPMVMVLHGCKQTEKNMINETRLNVLAEQGNVIVVYPFITTYDGFRNPNCWGFWFDQHIHQGAGEAEDLYRIAREVENLYNIDPNRRYITGLSSGGAMAVVMAVAYSEYFAAGGAAAGLPYFETSASVGFYCANPGTFKQIAEVVSAMESEQAEPGEQRAVPFMVIHSINDCTVNKKASENIRDAWLQRYAASPIAYETTDCTAEGVACAHNKYGTPARSNVETVFYNGETGGLLGGGSHYWVGDNSGEFANPQGPSASELFWDFFQRHPFSENRPPSATISSGSATGTSITVSGSASDAEGSVVEVAVRLDGRHPQPPMAASETTSWSVTFENLPDHAFYTPVVTAKDNHGATTRVTGNPIAVGTPQNQAPAVSIDDVSVNATCIRVTGAASDSEGPVVKVEVELGGRGFKPADFEGSSYAYQECNLSGGTYTTKARATDIDGASTTALGQDAHVTDLEAVTANWQNHMAAGRLRVYSAPCNAGFGVCDVGFSALFLTYNFESFALHRDPASENWYINPEKINDQP